MRILVLIDGFRLGGAETLLIPFAVEALAQGHEVDLVSIAPSDVASTDVLDQYGAAGLSVQFLGIRRLLQPGAILRVAASIRAGGYDVVHAHLAMAITLAVPAGALARRPVVASFHTLAPRYEGRARLREVLAVRASTRAKVVLFASRASMNSYAAEHFDGAAPQNWRVVHNGIDVSDFQPGRAAPEVRRQLTGGRTGRAAGREFVAVLPAAFRKPKGITDAIAAWRTVVDRHPTAVLALVGGGPEEQVLRQAVRERELEDSVVFTGVRSDMPEVYRATDIVILPSLDENLPTVLIEAGAAGRPVVATRIGGIPEIVIDGQTGLLCDAADPPGIADRVVRLLEDTEFRTDTGLAAVAWIQSEFSAEAWVTRLSMIYREVSR